MLESSGKVRQSASDRAAGVLYQPGRLNITSPLTDNTSGGGSMSPQDRTDATALQEAGQAVPAIVPAADKRRTRMPQTILIADDEPAFRDYLGTLLRTQGFRVVAAG